MASVQPGQQVSFSLVAHTDGFTGAVGTFAEISAVLQGQGIRILNPNVTQSLLATVGAAGYDASFQATFIAVSNAAYGDANDLASIIAGVVYNEVGDLPTSLAIVEIEPIGTPEPGAGAGAPGGGASIVDAISNVFNGITGATTTILVAIAAIIVLVLVLIAYGPNVKHVAGALA